jgi:hypothetical protein
VGLERGPLSLVMIIELVQGNSGSGLENKLTTVGESLRWPRDTLYPLKLVLTSPTRGGRSVGIVRACGLKPRSLFCFYYYYTQTLLVKITHLNPVSSYMVALHAASNTVLTRTQFLEFSINICYIACLGSVLWLEPEFQYVSFSSLVRN